MVKEQRLDVSCSSDESNVLLSVYADDDASIATHLNIEVVPSTSSRKCKLPLSQLGQRKEGS